MAWETYKNLGAHSSVVEFDISEGSQEIAILFSGSGFVYLYGAISVGTAQYNAMVSKARQGFGLNSYIKLNNLRYFSKE